MRRRLASARAPRRRRSSKGRRAVTGKGEGGVEGCEGVDGVEQGASTAAREAEGDDEDEVMVGDKNISMQRAESSGGTTGGIQKKKCKRSRQKNRGQRQAMARFDRRLAADDANVN
jgi:hypothetical protein